LLLVWLVPRVMRSREAFKLTTLLVIYNAALTLLNLYICVEVSCKSKSYISIFKAEMFAANLVQCTCTCNPANMNKMLSLKVNLEQALEF